MHATPDRLRLLLRDLPPDDRAMLECRIVDGWRYGEIAAHLAVSRDGLADRVRRLRADRRRHWKAEGFWPFHTDSLERPAAARRVAPTLRSPSRGQLSAPVEATPHQQPPRSSTGTCGLPAEPAEAAAASGGPTVAPVAATAPGPHRQQRQQRPSQPSAPPRQRRQRGG
jgi:hypothetical protein